MAAGAFAQLDSPPRSGIESALLAGRPETPRIQRVPEPLPLAFGQPARPVAFAFQDVCKHPVSKRFPAAPESFRHAAQAARGAAVAHGDPHDRLVSADRTGTHPAGFPPHPVDAAEHRFRAAGSAALRIRTHFFSISV